MGGHKSDVCIHKSECRIGVSPMYVSISQMCVCLSQMCIDISLLGEGIGLKARMRHALSGRFALLFLFIYKESGCE